MITTPEKRQQENHPTAFFQGVIKFMDIHQGVAFGLKLIAPLR
jgi:hypothetical protein